MAIINNDKSDEYWLSVAAEDIEEKTWIVPNGETWKLQEIDGSGAGANAMACMLWDDVLLFSTITSLKLGFNKDLVGDGTKALKAVLDNGTNSTQPMGLRFNARKI